jgi:hypothetical protein
MGGRSSFRAVELPCNLKDKSRGKTVRQRAGSARDHLCLGNEGAGRQSGGCNRMPKVVPPPRRRLWRVVVGSVILRLFASDIDGNDFQGSYAFGGRA